MSEQVKPNMRVWDQLCKTDPIHTKKFKRAGGFSGTAIKPIWTILRMTEMFGPCGIGWGMEEPKFTTEVADKETLVFCTVAVWYMLEAVRGVVYGVGGDKVVLNQSGGLRASDEARKMAYTDAIGNAIKFIGVAADVHMGLFDDNKYVKEMEEEFRPKTEPSETPNKIKFITKAQATAFRSYLNGRIDNGTLDKKQIRAALDELKLMVIDEIPDDRMQEVRDVFEGL